MWAFGLGHVANYIYIDLKIPQSIGWLRRSTHSLGKLLEYIIISHYSLYQSMANTIVIY